MLMQKISPPRIHQILELVAAVQRDVPKAVIELCQIGSNRNRSFAAHASNG